MHRCSGLWSVVMSATAASLAATSCTRPEDVVWGRDDSNLAKTLGTWELVEPDSLFHNTGETWGTAKLWVSDGYLHFQSIADVDGPLSYSSVISMPLSKIEDGPNGWAGLTEYTRDSVHASCRLQALIKHRDTIEVHYQENYKDPRIENFFDQPDMLYWSFYLNRKP